MHKPGRTGSSRDLPLQVSPAHFSTALTEAIVAEFPAFPLWTDALKIRAMLIDDDWQSPDTYSKFFAPVTDGPAVYLFTLHDRTDCQRALVAYVGMATRLCRRFAAHEVLRELRATDYWVMRWFKSTPIAYLRARERRYIGQFDPRWNIIGRRRGINLP